MKVKKHILKYWTFLFLQYYYIEGSYDNYSDAYEVK